MYNNKEPQSHEMKIKPLQILICFHENARFSLFRSTIERVGELHIQTEFVERRIKFRISIIHTLHIMHFLEIITWSCILF